MKLVRLAVLCALASAPVLAASPKPIRFEESARIRRVGGFSVSPDGRRVAYAVSTPDVEANTSRSAIWMVTLSDSGAGEPRRMTSGDKRDSDPRFSPDGRGSRFCRIAEAPRRSGCSTFRGETPCRRPRFRRR